MTEGLARQRRNLISISCLVVFLKFAGVEVDKLTFLGLDFGQINNPSALYVAIWIFFTYFLFRYYQYFCQEGSTKILLVYYEGLEELVISHIKRMAYQVSPIAAYHPHQLAALQKDNWMVRITYKREEDGRTGSPTNEVVDSRFPKATLWKYRIKASIKITLNTSVISDYILPFIIAIAAFIYGLGGADSSLLSAMKDGLINA